MGIKGKFLLTVEYQVINTEGITENHHLTIITIITVSGNLSSMRNYIYIVSVSFYKLSIINNFTGDEGSRSHWTKWSKSVSPVHYTTNYLPTEMKSWEGHSRITSGVFLPKLHSPNLIQSRGNTRLTQGGGCSTKERAHSFQKRQGPLRQKTEKGPQTKKDEMTKCSVSL